MRPKRPDKERAQAQRQDHRQWQPATKGDLSNTKRTAAGLMYFDQPTGTVASPREPNPNSAASRTSGLTVLSGPSEKLREHGVAPPFLPGQAFRLYSCTFCLL
ncbi:hypothetical protein PENSPDRAFT_339992 [Peniophora sp. CONT]|nr:hypothetical protein PENSPDRAFT_339992 [Peniophora sp. CONT]